MNYLTILIILVVIAILVYLIIQMSIEFYKREEIKSLKERRRIPLEIRYPILEKMFKFVCNKAFENDIKLIPVYGTLLGLEREKEIIKHDFDIDLFLFESDWIKFKQMLKYDSTYSFREVNLLWHHKYEIYDKETDLGVDFFRIYKSKNNIKLDVFLSFNKSGVRHGDLEWKTPLRKNFEKEYFEPLEEKTTIYGDLYFPNKSEKLLEQWYGEDWRTPIAE